MAAARRHRAYTARSAHTCRPHAMTPAPCPTDAASARLVLGIGLRASAQAAALHALWQRAQALLPALTPAAVQAVATLPHRAAHPALARWRAECGLGRAHTVAVPPQMLAAQPTHTASPQSLARYGCGSVAEACALWAAAGTQGHACLLLPRLVAACGSATLAVATPSSLQGLCP
ncbi:cobalt-precorrin 5A hydrolase [Vandammella animalimorsus]|uniref:Cobalt-precorrin 5A hydrolase n=2 Tax=Vandammella animalimorsus TaxID=2029117 RepID=A0A2A2ANV8_9BURK|nr:cobalt-precorrin 5A hydrolase [Vandammella animalimorsus]